MYKMATDKNSLFQIVTVLANLLVLCKIPVALYITPKEVKESDLDALCTKSNDKEIRHLGMPLEEHKSVDSHPAEILDRG